MCAGLDEQEQREANYPNEDDLYEQGRDDECDMMEEALQEVFDKFVKQGKGIGYYKNSPEKFVRHAIGDLLFMAKGELSFDIDIDNLLEAQKEDFEEGD